MFVIVNGVIVVIWEVEFPIVECVKRKNARRNANFITTRIVTGIIKATRVTKPEVFLVLQKKIIITSK